MSKNSQMTDGHFCNTYDDECICETCESDTDGYPYCVTCNKDKGIMLG